MLRAVTFDYWQTLVAERPGGMRDVRLRLWAEELARVGQPRTAEDLDDAFVANWTMFDERWLANTGQWGAVETVDFVGERLALSFEDGLRERLIDTFRIVAERADLVTAPNLEPCLRALRDAGLRLGIVCDVGLTAGVVLRERLEAFGLLSYFDAWSFSDETGWFKPAAESFWPALSGLGVEPGDAAHVGDNDRTDIAGALDLGMVAVHYLGLRHAADWLDEPVPSPRADHVLYDHADLPAALGI
ncbi:MAG TPA: HAD family hydrolase [Actinomycetota bacterium]|nr:HAD family hydrolase [Actinomycetota bacterium]